MRWPWPTLALAAAVLLLQGQLWLGGDNMPQVMKLRTQLETQRAANGQAQRRNERAAAEGADLREGLEMIEEKARSELGMVKPDEILVQYTRTGSAGAATASTAAAMAPAAAAEPRR